MCKMASFKFKPTGAVALRVSGSLDSHHNIPGDDGSKPNDWREGHYLHDGTIECRVLDVDELTGNECADKIRKQWPTFTEFFAWAIEEANDGLTVGGSLDLYGCTGLTALPDGLTVSGYLYLGGCTGLTALPDGLTVGGSLYLDGCAGLTALPDGLTVGGYLDLYGCTGLTALPDGLESRVGGCIYRCST